MARSRRAAPSSPRQAAQTPPPFSRTKWTRRVPRPVLIGHVASLTTGGADYAGPGAGGPSWAFLAAVCGTVPPPPPPFPPRTKWTRRVPHPVLIGHAVCLVQVAAGLAALAGTLALLHKAGVLKT